MTNEQFRRLVRDFCKLTRIDDVDTVLATGSVTVDGIAFSVYASQETDDNPAEFLMIYCDFGPPPEKNQLAVLRRLLEVNIYLAGGSNTGSYSINPETGHVVLACQIKLGTAPPEELALMLESCAREARQWSQSHYVDAQPGTAGGSAYDILGAAKRRASLP